MDPSEPQAGLARPKGPAELLPLDPGPLCGIARVWTQGRGPGRAGVQGLPAGSDYRHCCFCFLGQHLEPMLLFKQKTANPGGGQWSLVYRPAPGGDARRYPDRRVLRNPGDPEVPLCSSALLGSTGSEAPGQREGVEVLRPGLLPALHKVPGTCHKIHVSTGWDRSSWMVGAWRRRWRVSTG